MVALGNYCQHPNCYQIAQRFGYQPLWVLCILCAINKPINMDPLWITAQTITFALHFFALFFCLNAIFITPFQATSSCQTFQLQMAKGLAVQTEHKNQTIGIIHPLHGSIFLHFVMEATYHDTISCLIIHFP